MVWGAKQAAAGVYSHFLRELMRRVEIRALLSDPTLPQALNEAGIAAMNDERDRTARVGTATHAGIEHYVKTGKIVVDEVEPVGVRVAVETFDELWREAKPNVIFAPEMPVYSLRHGYAGQIDIAVELDARTCAVLQAHAGAHDDTIVPGVHVIDIKTGTYLWQNHAQQLAAYAEALQETSAVAVKGGLVISIHRDAPSVVDVHVFGVNKMRSGFEAFLHCKALWKFHKQPKWHKEQEAVYGNVGDGADCAVGGSGSDSTGRHERADCGHEGSEDERVRAGGTV